MRKIILCLLVFVVTFCVIIFGDELTKIYYSAIKYFNPKELVIEKNKYYREYDFEFVQNTVDFEPQNFDDILNIFYTVINSGQETFSFYCPDEYTSCTQDIKKLANDQAMLSHINNFVHPFNGFKHIETQYSTLGEVTITVFKNYDVNTTSIIEQKVDEIIKNNIYDSYTDIEKIRIAHDYIIRNSRYDVERSEHNVITYNSDTAYGPLFEGYGICTGYSDAMQLFLEKFGIKNYKVASDTHIWNAVYVDGAWYHLDLTWDDPITPDGTQLLEDEYFMINTNVLTSKGNNEHSFNYLIYSEVMK